MCGNQLSESRWTLPMKEDRQSYKRQTGGSGSFIMRDRARLSPQIQRKAMRRWTTGTSGTSFSRVTNGYRRIMSPWRDLLISIQRQSKMETVESGYFGPAIN